MASSKFRVVRLRRFSAAVVAAAAARGRESTSPWEKVILAAQAVVYSAVVIVVALTNSHHLALLIACFTGLLLIFLGLGGLASRSNPLSQDMLNTMRWSFPLAVILVFCNLWVPQEAERLVRLLSAVNVFFAAALFYSCARKKRVRASKPYQRLPC